MKALRNRRRGFTLVEVLMVVGILVMLAGVVIGFVLPAFEKSKAKGAHILIESVCSSLDRYKLDMGSYPTETDGLDALRKAPEAGGDKNLAEKWGGPYLTKDPVDPWGNKLKYTPTEAGSPDALAVPFKIYSFGPNGQDDNGADDDIRNTAWEESETKK